MWYYFCVERKFTINTKYPNESTDSDHCRATWRTSTMERLQDTASCAIIWLQTIVVPASRQTLLFSAVMSSLAQSFATCASLVSLGMKFWGIFWQFTFATLYLFLQMHLHVRWIPCPPNSIIKTYKNVLNSIKTIK